MSRVGKAKIELPVNVDIIINPNSILVKGPKGSLSQHCHNLVTICKVENKFLEFKPSKLHPDAWSHAGTVRAIVSNMIKGVTFGFERTLELVGVGYRAQMKGNIVALSLGFSHPVEYQLPDGVLAETPNNTTIILRSADKQLLGQVAAEIRSHRPPEPYKGKGIKYSGERINRKEAKKK